MLSFESLDVIYTKSFLIMELEKRTAIDQTTYGLVPIKGQKKLAFALRAILVNYFLKLRRPVGRRLGVFLLVI
jgi:hypothetical protein